MTNIRDLYSTTITSRADIRPAARQIAEIAKVMGNYRVAASANIASKEPMMDEDGAVLAEEIFGWTGPNERWWLNTRLALTSPVVRACRYESDVFWCNAKGFHTRQPNAYLNELDRNDWDKRAGVESVIVAPVHLPFGQIGNVCFVSTARQQDIVADYEKYANDLMQVCHQFIGGYVKATRLRQSVPGDCQLTKREVECLRWAAVGKTDREISMILARSHATVRFHIKNAGEKLNTVNRSQTIFKAAQLGFLNVAA